MPGHPVLEIEGLEYSYGPVQVLFGVDLEIGRGETVALLGTNGAGKTTLLRIVSGLAIPDRGTVRLEGVDITRLPAEDRYRAGMVHLRGGAGVFGELDVRENLHASLLRSGASVTEVRERVARAFDLFPELHEKRSERARDLSGGQQQILALGMCLVQEPVVLLVDELSMGLAPAVVERLLGVLDSLHDRGVAMLIVEQSVNLAVSIADRIVVLEKGEVRFGGTADDLAGHEELLGAVFLGGSQQ